MRFSGGTSRFPQIPSPGPLRGRTLRVGPRSRSMPTRSSSTRTSGSSISANQRQPWRGAAFGRPWLHEERGTSASDGSGPKTRYHLLTTDGGLVADQPGKMAGEAAIGVVLEDRSRGDLGGNRV